MAAPEGRGRPIAPRAFIKLSHKRHAPTHIGVSETAYCSKKCPVRRWQAGLHGHKQEGRQKRVFDKMREASNARTHAEVVKMAEERQAVAEELRRAKPDVAAEIHGMLGANSLAGTCQTQTWKTRGCGSCTKG